MSESSFEFVNKKQEEMDHTKKEGCRKSSAEIPKGSLVQNPLPDFLPSTSTAFHPSTFSAAIPESVAEPGKTDDEKQSVLSPTGLFDWMKDTVGNKGTNLLSKVKSSVDTVINTLDPQIKLTSDGVLVVASEKEVEVGPIRNAFYEGFNKFYVRGLEASADLPIARQVVGFESASHAAQLKIDSIRQMNVKGPIVAIQNFIVKIRDDKWFDADLIILNDTTNNIFLETYSQMTPVPSNIATTAEEETSHEYAHQHSGFSISVASLLGGNLQIHPSEWHEFMTGVSRKERIFATAKVIVSLYKNTVSQV